MMELLSSSLMSSYRVSGKLLAPDTGASWDGVGRGGSIPSYDGGGARPIIAMAVWSQ